MVDNLAAPAAPANPPQQPGAGRVLVLLDGSQMSFAALEAAADIASGRGADVLGVFVEELNLLRSAGYGFAREVGAISGTSRPLNTALMEQRMRRLADQARRALGQAMAARGGRHSLNICRGSVVAEVLELAGPEDVLVLGRAGWASQPGLRLGSTARGLIQRAPGTVILWTSGQIRPRGSVVVLADGFDDSLGKLNAAAELARQHRRSVTVLHQQSAASLDPRMRDWIAQQQVPVQLVRLPDNDHRAVLRALRDVNGALLVCSRRDWLFRQQGIEQFLEALSLPVAITP
ncbi:MULTISPECIES: universal stress protein [Marinobacter]|uniref:Universal stress protein UspA n=1 Tax=Marinobacter profundi TaxID=2666256 RepID=A0A2G1UQB8_9GAMM|nr:MULTISPECIES: universal stress protein [Marinobacter]MBD3656836.1 universal stress protein [Marinobacter sp.]PHQ16697.1 universal stress protein UspA [Marinobacter profundi]